MDIGTILGNLGFDWRVAAANLVNFLIIFFVLKKFAFGPIRDVLEARRARIVQGLEDAERAARDRMMAEESFTRRVADAKEEANRIVSDAKLREEALAREAEAHALAEAAAITRRAQENIARDRATMERDIRRQSAFLVVAGIEKIVREEFDDKTHERFIQKVIHP